jgi:uncharacterized protein YeaO (DUF488 family)
MEIGTMQLGREAIAWEYGLKIYDITVKSGLKEFAPEWGMVLNLKAGNLSPHGYTLQYLKRMQESQVNHPDQWKQLLSEDRIALACYCPKGCFCHRDLLLEIIKEKVSEDGGEVIDLGFIG